MMHLFKSSTKAQLIFLVIISILPALGIIIYSGAEQRSEKIRAIEDSTGGLIQTVSNRHQVIMESSRQLLIALSKIPDVQNLNHRACDALFKELLPVNPLYTNIFMADRNGIVLSSTIPANSLNVRHRKYFRDAMATRNFSTSEYLVAHMSKSPVFPLSYPILDGKGKVKGVIALSLDLKRYDFIISETNLPVGSELSLTDYRGIRLYHYPKGDAYMGQPDRKEMMRHMSGHSDEGRFEETGTDGVKRFYAFKRFRLSKDSPPYLYMRLGIPEDQALAEARSVTMRNLILLTFVFTLALLSAWFLGSYLITGPISRLTLLTNRFRQGDRDLRIDTSPINGEIGNLTKSFHEMVLVIKHREQERDRMIAELQRALSDVKRLSGLLPICASCKKIRDDRGYWNQLESYIGNHSEAQFSHGLCPECTKKLYPELCNEDGTIDGA